MKNNQNKWRAYQVKFSIFTLLLLTVSACLSSRSSRNSVDSPSRNEVASDNKKVKTKPVSKPVTQNATAGDENESTDENADEHVDEDNSDLIKRVCRKYDSCGSQDYETCMAESENVNYDDEVYKCILKSSCKSLKAGKPDACTGAGNNTELYVPEKPACPQIRCSKNADCPGTCYGGCKNGICLLF